MDSARRECVVRELLLRFRLAVIVSVAFLVLVAVIDRTVLARAVADDATGLDLCTVILDLSTKVAKLPTDYAIEVMKAEIRQIF